MPDCVAADVNFFILIALDSLLRNIALFPPLNVCFQLSKQTSTLFALTARDEPPSLFEANTKVMKWLFFCGTDLHSGGEE